MKTRYYLPFFLILFISACATRPPVSVEDRSRLWDEQQARNDSLDSWQIAGRMSVRMDDDAWSASLYWQQEKESFNLRVVAPLAQGSAMIEGNSEFVTLTTGEGVSYSDRNVELLMQNTLGWNAPVSALRYWVKGLPEPLQQSESLKIDEYGRLTALQQSGWQVIIQSYTRSGELQLPSRLQLAREYITIRLSINKWDTKPDE